MKKLWNKLKNKKLLNSLKKLQNSLKKLWNSFLKNKWDSLKNKKISLPLYTIVGALCLLLLMFSCSGHTSKIAVVNMNRVYAEAKVFQNIHNDQQTFENEWKKQALAEREKLEKADRDLARKKSRMRRAQFEKEVTILKEKILDFQNQQMAKLDSIRHQTNVVMARVESTMKPITEQIAKDKKLDFILSASNALYYDKSVDITDEIIKQLDKAFKAGELPILQINLNEGE